MASRLQIPVAVQALFDNVVPSMAGRNGGYTRILKLGQRRSDGSEMCLLQWVVLPAKAVAEAAPAAAPAAEAAPAPAAEKPAKKAAPRSPPPRSRLPRRRRTRLRSPRKGRAPSV